mmetsp:Transcript_7165/g.30517  ORF Transcript_7165/g.30517 Transcript_7165/m.30517 type:complete len:237 (-) Transcript_7165:439-1149(-)
MSSADRSWLADVFSNSSGSKSCSSSMMSLLIMWGIWAGTFRSMLPNFCVSLWLVCRRESANMSSRWRPPGKPWGAIACSPALRPSNSGSCTNAGWGSSSSSPSSSSSSASSLFPARSLSRFLSPSRSPCSPWAAFPSSPSVSSFSPSVPDLSQTAVHSPLTSRHQATGPSHWSSLTAAAVSPSSLSLSGNRQLSAVQRRSIHLSSSSSPSGPKSPLSCRRTSSSSMPRWKVRISVP